MTIAVLVVCPTRQVSPAAPIVTLDNGTTAPGTLPTIVSDIVNPTGTMLNPSKSSTKDLT